MKKVILLGAVFVAAFSAKAQDDTYGSHENHDVVTQQEAHYPGGDRKLIMHVYKHAPYSDEAIEKYAEGTVQISFMVQTDSTVSDIVVMMDTDPSCSEAVISILKEEKFAPAIQNGTAVPMELIMGFPVKAYRKH